MIMTEIINHLRMTAIWLALTYSAVIAAMAVDFVSGVRKARAAGIATRSRGFKMTTEKAGKYFLPMLCLTCIDIITTAILPAPFLTMIMGAFNIFCEWKSVFESTHDKQEIREAANTVQVIVKNKEDVANAFSDILEKLARENEEQRYGIKGRRHRPRHKTCPTCTVPLYTSKT